MKAATRYRVTDPETGKPKYFKVDQLAALALTNVDAIYKRIKRGVTGDALIAPVRDKATTKIEAAYRAKLRRAVKNKYKRTCPNCGHIFDTFQPDHILREVKPGSV